MKKKKIRYFFETLALLTICFSIACVKRTDDEYMLSHFEKHRSEFERLVEIAKPCCDGSDTIAWDHDLKEESGKEECVQLLKATETRGFVFGENFTSGTIEFFPSWGSLDYHCGRSKGYMYSKNKLSPIFQSLDEKPDDLKHYQTGYKPIAENWFIYYEND